MGGSSALRHPKRTFAGHPTALFSYGSCETFGVDGPSHPRLKSIRAFLDDFLNKHGVLEAASEFGSYHTGGHMDIDYYALIMSDQDGGCECIFYTIWGEKHESMVPTITLYGTWSVWNDLLSEALTESWIGKNSE
jgi:hypothetical protein